MRHSIERNVEDSWTLSISSLPTPFFVFKVYAYSMVMLSDHWRVPKKREFRVTRQWTFLCALGQKREGLGNGACVCASVLVQRQTTMQARETRRVFAATMAEWHMSLTEYNDIELILVLQWLFILMPMLNACSLSSLHTPSLLLVLPDSKSRVHRHVVAFPPSPFLRPFSIQPFPSFLFLPLCPRTLTLALICAPLSNPTFIAHAHLFPFFSSMRRISSFSAVVCLFVCCCVLLSTLNHACDKQTVYDFCFGCLQSDQSNHPISFKACLMSIKHVS